MLAMILGAVLLTSAPLDAGHAAVLAVVSRDPMAVACAPGELRKAVTNTRLVPLGRLQGDAVVLSAVQVRCLCGEHNCQQLVIRYGSGAPRVLLAGLGWSAERSADPGSPLPRISVLSHDSAMVNNEEAYAYRDGRYVMIGSARVRSTDMARKPFAVAVRFAAGASSAALHGTSSRGWNDEYTFDAARGQKLTIEGLTSPGPIRLNLIGPTLRSYVTIESGVPFPLPASGTYRLQVEGVGDDDVPYRLRLAIR